MEEEREQFFTLADIPRPGRPPVLGEEVEEELAANIYKLLDSEKQVTVGELSNWAKEIGNLKKMHHFAADRKW